MKEDHMRNGQLKPAYNLQISTADQFVLHYSLHPNPTDTKTLKSHLSTFKEQYGRAPKEVVADAGYGSEQNYLMLQKENIVPFVKYNYFHKDLKNKRKKETDPEFDSELQCYICPKGKPLFECGKRKRRLSDGYEQTVTVFKAVNCQSCPLKETCKVRVFRRNQKLFELQTSVQQLLTGERGIMLRKKRCWDVETVFAQIKNNKGFRRFNLRGMKKVEIETGLLAIAHNLKKWTA
jgi:hypothetical protein